MNDMQKLIFATNNKHKAHELRDWFERNFDNPPEIVTLADLGLGDPVEDGETFADNAYIKAKFALDQTGLAAIADDSGLCVDILDGAPGIYSARYAGEGETNDKCIAKLLKELDGIEYERRTAYFACAICLLLPDGRRIDAFGRADGYIANECRGDGSFGYDPVFYCPSLGKTFAELDTASKSAISHRGRALEDLKVKANGLF